MGHHQPILARRYFPLYELYKQSNDLICLSEGSVRPTSCARWPKNSLQRLKCMVKLLSLRCSCLIKERQSSQLLLEVRCSESVVNGNHLKFNVFLCFFYQEWQVVKSKLPQLRKIYMKKQKEQKY